MKPKTGNMTSHNASPLKQSQDLMLLVNDSPIRERKAKCDPYFKNDSIHRKSIDQTNDSLDIGAAFEEDKTYYEYGPKPDQPRFRFTENSI